MDKGKLWGNKVFDCNYRGDFVSLAEKKNRRSRRKKSGQSSVSKLGLLELTELKFSVCKRFMMRLEADKVEVNFYENQSIQRGIPLTTGIGSGEVDRNSVDNLDLAKREIAESAKLYVNSIKNVCMTISLPDDNYVAEPWPSHIYFEDLNGETQFEMVELILEEVYKNPKFIRIGEKNKYLPK